MTIIMKKQFFNLFDQRRVICTIFYSYKREIIEDKDKVSNKLEA